MFHKIILDYDTNLFDELASTTNFEKITNGRDGAVLVSVAETNGHIPLVRTTTKYTCKPQQFQPIHYDIINKIINSFNKSIITNITFNNALIEIYNNQYCNMGFHSDQALDLEDDWYIAVYSCYEHPLEINNNNTRQLIIVNKVTKEQTEINMDHNSVIIFDTSTNKQYLHKIVSNNNKICRWLGITFRLSKTFVTHKDGIPYLNNTTILTLATDEECKEFYKLRCLENKQTDFVYSNITYTISSSDL